MRMIPARIVPFGMVRTKYFVLGSLPLFTSFDPMVLVESNRLNLLRLRLCTKVRMLRLDLLHLLRSRFLHLGPCISLHVLLAGRRSRTGFSRGLLHTLPLLALLSLLLPARRRHSCRMTGNIRSRRRSICRFLLSPTLSAFSSTRLIRRFTGRLGGVRFWRVRRLAASVSFLALVSGRLIHGRALIRGAAFLHRSGFRRSLLGLGCVRARLRFSRVRSFWGALVLGW